MRVKFGKRIVEWNEKCPVCDEPMKKSGSNWVCNCGTIIQG